MTDVELRAETRRLCGNPSVNEASHREIDRAIAAALEQLAERLGYRIVTDETSAALTADDPEVPLPDDLLRMIWVLWNGTYLESSTTYAWERGTNGRGGVTDWRTITGNPSEYAILGRSLALYPVPDDDAITTDSVLSLRYIGASPGASAGGVNGLSSTDYYLAAAMAAKEWLGTRLADDKHKLLFENASRKVKEDFPEALARRRFPIDGQTFTPNVFTRRTGGRR